LLQRILEQQHAGVILPCGVGPLALSKLHGSQLPLPLSICCLLHITRLLGSHSTTTSPISLTLPQLRRLLGLGVTYFERQSIPLHLSVSCFLHVLFNITLAMGEAFLNMDGSACEFTIQTHMQPPRFFKASQLSKLGNIGHMRRVSVSKPADDSCHQVSLSRWNGL